VLIQALGLESAVALGGVRLIPITGRSAKLPRITLDPRADWTSELEELPSDAGNADTIELIPAKIGTVSNLSTEAIADSSVDQLDQVGRSLVRGVAKQVDSRFFSSLPAQVAPAAPAPAGILNSATLPSTQGAINIVALVRAVGKVAAAGGRPNIIWLHPDTLTELRVEAMTGGFATLADPQEPGIEALAGARLVATPALPTSWALVADTNYVLAGVRRDAAVAFSSEAAFSRDAVVARVTMRLSWSLADEKAVHALKPAPTV
jgi:HK97 family phage major capsid protein